MWGTSGRLFFALSVGGGAALFHDRRRQWIVFLIHLPSHDENRLLIVRSIAFRNSDLDGAPRRRTAFRGPPRLVAVLLELNRAPDRHRVRGPEALFLLFPPVL